MAIEPSGGIEVVTLLVEGAIGDYAAYQGVGSDAFIAQHGTKLSFYEAACHWPNQLKAEKYRP